MTNQHIHAQQTPPAVVPGYYNASRMEVAEELCVFENHRFVYALSYGVLDLLVKGTWTQQKDTVYLSTDKVKEKYILQSSVDKTVPAGKMLLVFRFNEEHAHYINFSFSPHPLLNEEPPKTNQTSEGFEALVDQPAYRHLQVIHTLYDTAFSDYVLPPDVNKIYVLPGDALGKPQFDHLPFLWKEGKLWNVRDDNREFKYSAPIAEKDKIYAKPDKE